MLLQWQCFPFSSFPCKTPTYTLSPPSSQQQKKKKKRRKSSAATSMQRLSIGSPGAKPRFDAAVEEVDEKTAKPAVRVAPDKSIHLIPLLTLLCFLVLLLLSHDPAPAPSSSSLNDSPVLAVTARSLEARAETTASIGRGSGSGSGVYRRLKEDPRQARGGRRLGMAR